jgi:predicted negative regulator of RcsB-dependent stress response
MKRLILLVILGLVGWQGYDRYQHNRAVRAANIAAEADAPLPSVLASPQAGTVGATTGGSFKCDGRTHCSQMTSCAEATFFLKNCPGVKMDGNNDGVPCEQQWCKR